ncbi:uncharacterized protein ARMOST_19499 [Armillaria ostoyae]|uniref:Uncharacterized protein n=1 Tax=Armillaria ostoyae TaxID=47428 RepID=A0A284S4S2_ARMOS|nr:uncharacterized protein ARMOST_19499 [Armillaria ostoyae]
MAPDGIRTTRIRDVLWPMEIAGTTSKRARPMLLESDRTPAGRLEEWAVALSKPEAQGRAITSPITCYLSGIPVATPLTAPCVKLPPFTARCLLQQTISRSSGESRSIQLTCGSRTVIRTLGEARTGERLGGEHRPLSRRFSCFIVGLEVEGQPCIYAYLFGSAMYLQLRVTPDGITVFVTRKITPNIMNMLSCHYCTEYERMFISPRETSGKTIGCARSYLFGCSTTPNKVR